MQDKRARLSSFALAPKDLLLECHLTMGCYRAVGQVIASLAKIPEPRVNGSPESLFADRKREGFRP